MTRNHRQEALCRACIQAVAGQWGMTYATPFPDYGTDLVLGEIEIVGNSLVESGNRVDVQAKSTALPQQASELIPFDLDIRTFNWLRATRHGNPRILVVLVLPEDESQWLTQTSEEFVVRHCVYWLSVAGMPGVKNR